jgi:hypothetical protein
MVSICFVLTRSSSTNYDWHNDIYGCGTFIQVLLGRVRYNVANELAKACRRILSCRAFVARARLIAKLRVRCIFFTLFFIDFDGISTL